MKQPVFLTMLITAQHLYKSCIKNTLLHCLLKKRDFYFDKILLPKMRNSFYTDCNIMFCEHVKRQPEIISFPI